MIKQYKNIIILIAAIIIVVAGAVFLPRLLSRNKKAAKVAVPTLIPCLEGEKFSTATGKPCPKPEEPTTAPTTAVVHNGTTSYAETLALYSGKTVTIAAQCTMNPQVLSVAKGTRFLLVNTDKSPVTFTYGTETITLKSLRYATRIAQANQVIQCGTEKTTVAVQ